MTRKERGEKTLLADEARRAYRKAVKSKAIKKPQRCERCLRRVASSDLHGHHFNYKKALEVTFLCGRCHRNVHLLLQWMDLCYEWLEYCKDNGIDPKTSHEPHLSRRTGEPTKRDKFGHWQDYIYRPHSRLPNL